MEKANISRLKDSEKNFFHMIFQNFHALTLLHLLTFPAFYVKHSTTFIFQYQSFGTAMDMKQKKHLKLFWIMSVFISSKATKVFD